MASFRIEIAGRVAQVNSLFESTRDYCRRYLTDGEPEVFLTVTAEALAVEQALLAEEARQEGLRPRTFADPFLERNFLQRKLAECLLKYDTLLFHGSAVAVDGTGYLFAAGCGTGKSTHTRLWRQVFGDRAVMVNDDKPFLRVTDTGVWLCGSPWSGKHGLDTNITVPLQGICILQRARENRIRRSSPEAALPMLLQHSARPQDPGQQGPFTRLVNTLAESVPLWHLGCNMDPEAAILSHAAISGIEK